MITIKKINKINELFTFDGQNMFSFKEDGPFTFFTDETGVVYKVVMDTAKLNNKLKTLYIEYGIDSGENYTIFEPTRGKLDNNKLKIFNTILNIIKRKIDNFDPDIIKFSGDIENGLGNFYTMLIKSLRLPQYEAYIRNYVKYKKFLLIKEFEFIDCRDIMYYQQEGNIFKIEYTYDGLNISFLDMLSVDKLDSFNLEKVIKYCIPDRETIVTSWIEDGDGWVIIDIGDLNRFNIPENEITKTIQYLETLGLKFHRKDKKQIVFYDPTKVI